MRRFYTAVTVCAAAAFALAIAIAAAPPAAADGPVAPGQPGFARYVMQKIDDMYRGQRSYGRLAMKGRTTH